MRVLILAGLAIAYAAAPTAVSAKGSRTAVTITPRYLSAGTVASPFEYRGVVPQTDARFQPVMNSMGGRFEEWQQDPWLVPYKRNSFSFDFDGWSGRRVYRRY